MTCRHEKRLVDQAINKVLEELVLELIQMMLEEMVVLMRFIILVLTLYILGAPPISTS